MKSFYLIVLILNFCSIYCLNNRVLIALLSQESYTNTGHSYIAASYVKYLESAGARVVPVLINQDQSYYERVVNNTDGLLIPGGGQSLHTSGYAKAAQMLWNYTRNSSRFYPIWGTCLGFEMLLTLVNPQLVLDDCSANDVANNLTLTPDAQNSRLLGNSEQIREILTKYNVTYNHHMKCLLTTNIKAKTIEQYFKILSTTYDTIGKQYISTIESIDESRPVYGTQWHPEKNQFEFAFNGKIGKIPHSYQAITIGQYMANYFINQTRKSTRIPLPSNEEHRLLIYNYQPSYTGAKVNYEFEQVYFFNNSQPNLCSTICSNINIKNRVLIGILSEQDFGKPGHSFIVANYVKYLEGAGARVVPVFIDRNNQYYESIVNQTDGLLIPGENQYVNDSSYTKAGRSIFNYVMNNLSRPYPIWAVGSGFELILTLVDLNLKFDDCNATDVVSGLTFTSEAQNSRLLGAADLFVKDILQKDDVTYYNNNRCLSTGKSTEKINNTFKFLTTSKDRTGRQFISTVESYSQVKPIYGSEWHPEKNQFDFIRGTVPHTFNAVLIAQYMADFFVNQTRKSTRQMIRVDKEIKLLIYNYDVSVDTTLEQVFYFNGCSSNSLLNPLILSLISLKLIYSTIF